MSIFKSKPLKLRSQHHVDTVPSDIKRIAVLESEISRLRIEVQYHRDQQQTFAIRIQKYCDIAEAAKSWARDTMEGVKTIQTALLNLDKTRKDAEDVEFAQQGMVGNLM
jgi:uncharacterized small protein (DUF1192 family)